MIGDAGASRSLTVPNLASRSNPTTPSSAESSIKEQDIAPAQHGSCAGMSQDRDWWPLSGWSCECSPVLDAYGLAAAPPGVTST